MSMLAEPRSRQKWSHDPRNTNWSRDKTKFGYQMLTKMGWSEGKGLGQNLSGGVNHITVNKRGSNAGIGLKKSHDDDWIAHQDDFNALLTSLNQGSESTTGKISSLESRVKSSKKKILYKRFIKSKDLSNASSHDLACIFGQRNKSAPVTPQESDNGSESDSSVTSCPVNGNTDSATDISIKTVESGVSIADYFAKKMASLKQKMNESERTLNTDQNSCENDIVEECAPIEKKKKKKKNKSIPQCTEIGSDDNSKKRKCESNDLIIEDGLVKKKKKKSDRNISVNVEYESVPNYQEQEPIKKLKKKKKKKHDIDDNET